MVRRVLRWPLAAGVGFLALMAFVAHASIAEAWIRPTRKRCVPRRSGAGQRMMPTAKEGR